MRRARGGGPRRACRPWPWCTGPAAGSPHRPRRMRSCATGDAHDGDTMPSRTGHDPGRQVDRESIRGEPAVVLRAGETFAITTWPAALHRVGTAFPAASRSAAVTAWGCPDDMPPVPSEESQADPLSVKACQCPAAGAIADPRLPLAMRPFLIAGWRVRRSRHACGVLAWVPTLLCEVESRFAE